MKRQGKKKRRGKHRKKNISKLSVMGTNANGIKSKKASLINVLNADLPQIFMLQETKLKRKNQIRLEKYEIFEKVRKHKGGGGIMIGISKDMVRKPVEVSLQDDVEILVIEIELGDLTVRFLTAYGPQEEDKEENINKFYNSLEEEIIACEERHCGLIMELDCNAKLGKDIIQGDPHNMSSNGKLLWDIVKRHGCTIVNATDKCVGVITRSRWRKQSKEESVIDFFIVNPMITPYIEKMEVDESKSKALTRFKKGITIPSDHNYLHCTFNIPVKKRKPARKEIYCLRNKNSLKIFKSKTSNTKKFSSCFTENGDVKREGQKWMKSLRSTISSCFKKVRITKKRSDTIQEQLDMRRKLIIDISRAETASERHNLEDELENLEEIISHDYNNKQFNKIKEQVESITNNNGTTNNAKVWKLRQKIFPKPAEQLVGKRDKDGNLVTNLDKIKEIYINGYMERLQHRKMTPELLRLKTLREELFQQRLNLSKCNKSPDWTMDDLDRVLKKLKGNKASDPTGLVNELFMWNNIGDDLKESILILMNKIKTNYKEPNFTSLANITSFWKRKGSKDDIENERGVFILNVIRMIKDKLIHNDIKKVLVMSDSQVGAREEYSIRNHLFIIYSCLNSAAQHESPPIDIHMYDLTKCFDGLWLEECCNNLYEAGVVDDKLALVYEGNLINKVAVKTPGGLTDRRIVERIVMQGGVTGPVCCAVQTDKMGKDALNNNQYLYMYKGSVGIPTLAMVDDIAKISVCGTPAVVDNAYINARIEQSKQLFNGTKCHSMHTGKQNQPCSVLNAHEQKINRVAKEKYVGDIITSDGKHSKNILDRRSKGIGVISEIASILNGLCLGEHYFNTALMLRQAMLLQVLLSNSETWLRLTKGDMKRLEGVDQSFLRRIFQVPISTPIAFLYLETGCIPIRYIMKMKRVMYLHHILTRKEDALISRAFWAQVHKPLKNDWCMVVKEDLDSIGLGHLSYKEIQSMKQESLRDVLKTKIRESAFTQLLSDKNRSSKLKSLQYTCLEIQPYLTARNKLNVREKRLLFRWRSHMINVKQNMGMKNAKCPLCKEANDTQYHLLTCPSLSVPQPWNVQSVAQALRQREIFIENEKERNRKQKATQAKT